MKGSAIVLESAGEVCVAEAARSGWLKRRTVRTAVAAMLILEVLAIVLVFRHESASHQADQARLRSDPRPDVWSRGNVRPAIDRPAIQPARGASIQPGDTVIGVEVAGHARAYRLGAFHQPTGHLVNDLVGGVPVSVSYCDRTDCVRVYTEPNRATPLAIEVVGMIDSEQVLKIAGILYFQKSGLPVAPADARAVIPYQVLEPVRTTWEAWMQAHPDTDIYIGDREAAPADDPTR